MTGYIMTLVTYFDTRNCSFIDLTFVWPWVQLKAGLEPPCQWMSFCKIWPSTCISFQVKSKMIIAIIFIYQFHLSTVCEMLCIGKLKLHVKSSHFRINLAAFSLPPLHVQISKNEFSSGKAVCADFTRLLHTKLYSSKIVLRWNMSYGPFVLELKNISAL